MPSRRRLLSRRQALAATASLGGLACTDAAGKEGPVLRAGAAATDITPAARQAQPGAEVPSLGRHNRGRIAGEKDMAKKQWLRDMQRKAKRERKQQGEAERSDPLITCPTCGQRVARTAQACPGCGHPFKAVTTERTGKLSKANQIIGVLAALVGLCWLIALMQRSLPGEPDAPQVTQLKVILALTCLLGGIAWFAIWRIVAWWHHG